VVFCARKHPADALGLFCYTLPACRLHVSRGCDVSFSTAFSGGQRGTGKHMIGVLGVHKIEMRHSVIYVFEAGFIRLSVEASVENVFGETRELRDVRWSITGDVLMVEIYQ
jgi:hypothetical protein